MHVMFPLTKGHLSIRTELFDRMGVPIRGGLLYMYCCGTWACCPYTPVVHFLRNQVLLLHMSVWKTNGKSSMESILTIRFDLEWPWKSKFRSLKIRPVNISSYVFFSPDGITESLWKKKFPVHGYQQSFGSQYMQWLEICTQMPLLIE